MHGRYQRFRGVAQGAEGLPVQRRALLHLDGLGAAGLGRRHQRQRQALLTCPTAAADAVHVHRRIAGQLHVDHGLQAGDVDAAGRHVGGHQHAETAVGEHRQHLVALALLQIAMQGGRGDALGMQRLDHLLALLAGLAEGHGAGRAMMPEQAHHGGQAILGGDLVEALANLRLAVLTLDADAQRRPQIVLGQALDAFRIGRREQQRLPPCRRLAEDVGDGVDEAHVEHAIGFVEHRDVEAVQHQGALAQVLLHPPRGADDHLGAMLQGSDLRTQRHAATKGQDLHVGRGARQATQFAGHLVRQFAGRTEHQRLTAEIARIESRQQADAKGRRLARTGLGLGDEVLALEDDGQAGRLDGRHAQVAEFGQIGLHGLGQRQGIEG